MKEKVDFLLFCENMAPHNYAQHFQDLFCLWQSGLRRDGYFVEFGALNGINVSNSYLLESLGWNGIVAEPHPAYGDIVRSNRKCNVSTDCVWTETGGEVVFKAVKGKPALSTISGVEYDDIKEKAGMRDNYVEHRVPTVSLVDLLASFDAPRHIDSLSIDTEGSELDILGAFDFDKYTFGTIVVEHGFSSKREPLWELLSSHGYVRMWTDLSEHDDWYVHATYVENAQESAGKVRQLLLDLKDTPESPNMPGRLRRLRALAEGTGDQSQALRLAMLVAAGMPDNAVVHSELAKTLAANGLVTGAIASYRKALEIDPNLATARRQLQRLIGA